jgi:hypothetical protein
MITGRLGLLRVDSNGGVRWFAGNRERTGSGERGAAHRMASESSGDGGSFAGFRRAITSIWGDLSRGKREVRERSAGAL